MEAEGRDVRLPVPVVLDDGPDGGSVLKASPSWRAHAATTRLTKKDFMVTAGMEIMDDVGANKIMLLMRCPVRRQHLLSSNAAAGLSTSQLIAVAELVKVDVTSCHKSVNSRVGGRKRTPRPRV